MIIYLKTEKRFQFYLSIEEKKKKREKEKKKRSGELM